LAEGPLAVVRRIPKLTKVLADLRIPAQVPKGIKRLRSQRSSLAWIAILYAPDKHFCWAFFDIRNEKYALDSGLARN
jgi:hypothetical protein